MPRKAGEKKKEMRETTNRTPAWVYVVSVVSAVALGLGTIAIADYLRPSKRAARQAAEQAEQERVSRAKAETQRKIAEAQERERERQEARKKEDEKSAVWSRYRNNEWRTEAEGYFFKGIKYAIGDGVGMNFKESVRNFRLARDLAGPNDINELERMLNELERMLNYFSTPRDAWNRSIHRLGPNW